MESINKDIKTVLVGTYTSPENKSAGIYVYHFNTADGSLKLISESPKTENPSFLAVNEAKDRVYAVNELDPEGIISTFSFDNHKLTLIDTQKTLGSLPCHVSLTRTTAVIANYLSGSVSSYKIKEDGKLQLVSNIQHEGTVGPHKERQEGPHAH
jgi:6-phosphogluconolactonase